MGNILDMIYSELFLCMAMLVKEKGAAGLQQIELDESKAHGQAFVGHIRGCDVPEALRDYTGKELLVPKSELPNLDQGYYWHQLEGLKVVNLAGEILGRVHHLMETGANDVLVVRPDGDSVDQEERLVPYVPGQVVTEVDLDQGLVRVNWDKDF